MRKTMMTLLCLLLMLWAALAQAQEMDLSVYSLDELIEMRSALDEEITLRQKQWALEHANRKVAFENDELLLFKGKSRKVAPIVTRMTEDAPEKTSFVWTSADPGVAKYSAENGITAVGKGTTVLTCTAKDDEAVTGSITVTVVLPVSGISIEAERSTLLLGSDPELSGVVLHASVEPADAHIPAVAWASSNEAVAVVDENGCVQAREAGTATITATSLDESSSTPKKASLKLTVAQAVTGIELNQTNLVLGTGKTAALKASVLPENASSKKVSWSTSDPEVATYSEGKITAKKPGSCTITATANDGSGAAASCSVTVVRLSTGISFPEKTMAMTAGQKKAATAEVLPEDATDKRVSWESSDTGIAMVSGSGIITAKKAGSCTITAVTCDGTEKKASLQLTVYPSLQEMLYSETWYYNGGSDTLLNRISFTAECATIEQVIFTGNGRSLNGSMSCPYTIGDQQITVELEGDKKLAIEYALADGKLSLGSGTFYTLTEIDNALQGYWKVRSSTPVGGYYITSEHNIYINKGKLKSESATASMRRGYDYFYYGPYSGTYTLGFGGFTSTMEHIMEWGFNIIGGKPRVLHYDHVGAPAKKLPGKNGYSL